jgi:hypothetical protein
MRRSLTLVALAALVIGLTTIVSGQRPKPDPRPNFEGIWNSATTTPLERPREMKNKAFFTPEEAAERDRELARRNAEPPPEPKDTRTGTGTYNTN